MAHRAASIRNREGRVNWISGTDKLQVSVSQCAVTQGEQVIEACQLCSLDASVPFSRSMFRSTHDCQKGEAVLAREPAHFGSRKKVQQGPLPGRRWNRTRQRSHA